VLVLGVLDGVIIGALLSLLLVIARASESRISVLGKVPGQPQFTNVRTNPENLIIPGLLIIRVEEGIFYANAESIRDQIMGLMWDANTPIETVILDLEMTSDLDLAGAEMLDELHSELRDLGVRLGWQGFSGPRGCSWLALGSPGRSGTRISTLASSLRWPRTSPKRGRPNGWDATSFPI
jgi:MFS superfamily sulfate permease-like transporter